MNKRLLRFAIAAGSLLCSNLMLAQPSPTTPKPPRVQITEGPEPERATDYLTIIRWTTNNPGGSPVHNGIVHYGTDPKNLNQTAKNPIRLNPHHPTTVFRVRIEGLKAGTTYYYTVNSEEAEIGKSDNVKSPVKRFTVEPQPGAASARRAGQ